MKKMKKLFAMLLTLAMVLGMSMTSFAANKNTISISGTGIDEATVKYGQLIQEDRTSTLGWKFATSTAITKKFVDAWNAIDSTKLTADGVIEAMISAGMLENPENKYVTDGTTNPSANFSKALNAVAYDVATSNFNKNGQDVSESGKGLYVITAQRNGYQYLPMAAYMNTAGDNVAVIAKGAENQINKTVADTGKSVAPGDEVNYTVDEQYLFIAPDANPKTFTITDTLTNGTFKKDSVQVVLKDTLDQATPGIALEKNIDYKITDYAGKTTLTIDFTEYYNSSYAGKFVVITYTAIAGSVTTSEPLTNHVSSNNGTGKTVEVKPVSFKVIKVDTKEANKKLPNAEFQIYKEVTEGTNNAVRLTVMVDETKNTTKTVYGLPVGAIIKTDKNGEASVDNLDAQGKYYVKETTAPNGYSLNNYAYELTGADVKTNNTTTDTEPTDGVIYTHQTYTYTNFTDITVKDSKLSALPSTGGIGTTIFTIAGCVIMIAAAGLFFASRKKSDNK